ncbi:MAG: SLBB domain-containing protein, partial [Deltaproteobacteria bacterium]|nr:SLBB domain-containing protein [Deltaproteobacteria bacterium]
VYELREEKRVQEILELAGNVLPSAYPSESKLNRINKKGERTVLDVDLSTEAGLKTEIRDGDVLRVASILDYVADVVLVSGHVERPGPVQWQAGMKLSDIFSVPNTLRMGVDLSYLVVSRRLGAAGEVQVLHTRLDRALENPGGEENLALEPGDEIYVFSTEGDRAGQLASVVGALRNQAMFREPEPVVTITGNVRKPGAYPLGQELRLRRLLEIAREVQPDTDLDYGLIRRELGTNAQIRVISFAPKEVLDAPEGDANLLLEPRDQVFIFALEQDRSAALAPILAQLSRQARQGEPAQIVHLGGRIMAPGAYPLEAGMRVRDLVFAGGKFQEAAYTLGAELTRQVIKDGKLFSTEHIPIDLPAAMAGDEQANLVLQAHDQLVIKELPLWRERPSVTIRGEVFFPGTYPVSRGESLRSLIERAGGPTEAAHLPAAAFFRKDLREKEQKEIDALAARLEADVAAMSQAQAALDPEQQQRTNATAQSLLKQLRQTKATGRLVIPLPDILDGTVDDVILEDGDVLYIPDVPQEVTVLGRVFYPTSHLYRDFLERDDFIEQSGGLTHDADDDRIYIVGADGAVRGSGGCRWFRRTKQRVFAGDSIVVPPDLEPMTTLAMWSDVSKIVYQLGISAAAFKTLGLF